MTKPKARNTENNRELAAKALGIEPKLVYAATKLGGAAAGLNANYTVNIDKLKKWIAGNEEAIRTYLDTVTLEDVRLDNAILDGEIKRLEISRLRGEFIDPAEVEKFLGDVFTNQNALLQKWRRDLGPKVAGKSLGECDKVIAEAVNELLQIFKAGKWTS